MFRLLLEMHKYIIYISMKMKQMLKTNVVNTSLTQKSKTKINKKLTNDEKSQTNESDESFATAKE